MCTLLTVDRDSFLTDRHAFIARMLRDAANNSDGFNLIAIDPVNIGLDLNVSCMNISMITRTAEAFFDTCSSSGRIFLHSRMATTDYVGIPFTHGFTDFKGTLIQHNGIVFNYRELHVDSYNLADLDLSDTAKTFNSLDLLGERFANVFLIRPNSNSYGVIRRMAGTLYTDYMGNYSTNMVADIDQPVEHDTHQDYNFAHVRPPVVGTKSYLAEKFDEAYSQEYAYETSWDSIVNKKIAK